MGCCEDICLKILCWPFLILSDYVENGLNLCPSSARRETVSAVCAQLLTITCVWLEIDYTRISLMEIIPFSIYLIEFLEYFFCELNVCRNNTFIILRYVEGGIPLRHPSKKKHKNHWKNIEKRWKGQQKHANNMGSSGFLQRNLEKMELGRVFDGGFLTEGFVVNSNLSFGGWAPKKIT